MAKQRGLSRCYSSSWLVSHRHATSEIIKPSDRWILAWLANIVFTRGLDAIWRSQIHAVEDRQILRLWSLMRSSKALIMRIVLGYLKQTLCLPVHREEMEAWSPLPYLVAFYLDWPPWTLGVLLQSWRRAEFPPGKGEARMGHTTVSMLNDFCDKGLLHDFVMKNFDPGHDNTNERQELQHRNIYTLSQLATFLLDQQSVPAAFCVRRSGHCSPRGVQPM